MVNISQQKEPIRLFTEKVKPRLMRAVDIRDIRKRNLLLLIDANYGGKKVNIARALGKQATEISRIYSKNPKDRRDIGHNFARKIEKISGLPKYWMDQPQWIREEPQAETFSMIPVINWQEAGPSLPSNTDKYRRMPVPMKLGPGAYGLIVRDDSMEPEFRPGDTIAIDPSRKPTHGSYVIARLSEEVEPTLKELVIDMGKWLLKPVNPRYPTIIQIDPSVIIGVVVFKYKLFAPEG